MEHYILKEQEISYSYNKETGENVQEALLLNEAVQQQQQQMQMRGVAVLVEGTVMLYGAFMLITA